jgi:hypothetical protein
MAGHKVRKIFNGIITNLISMVLNTSCLYLEYLSYLHLNLRNFSQHTLPPILQQYLYVKHD